MRQHRDKRPQLLDQGSGDTLHPQQIVDRAEPERDLLAPTLAWYRGEHALRNGFGEGLACADKRQQPAQYVNLARNHTFRPRKIAQIDPGLLVANTAGEIDRIAPVVRVEMGVGKRHGPRLPGMVHAGGARVFSQDHTGPVDRAAQKPFRLGVGQLVLRLARDDALPPERARHQGRGHRDDEHRHHHGGAALRSHSTNTRT